MSPRKVSFLIYCSEYDDGNFAAVPPSPPGITRCSNSFSIKSKAGCVAKGSSSLIGAILSFKTLCFVIAVFLIYVVVGLVYNKTQKGVTGIEAFPHIDFWRHFPLYVGEGVRFTFNKLRDVTGLFKARVSSGNIGGGKGYITVWF